jgi:hypothetical protein
MWAKYGAGVGYWHGKPVSTPNPPHPSPRLPASVYIYLLTNKNIRTVIWPGTEFSSILSTLVRVEDSVPGSAPSAPHCSTHRKCYKSYQKMSLKNVTKIKTDFEMIRLLTPEKIAY